jgi:phage terminase large subunit-like protein
MRESEPSPILLKSELVSLLEERKRRKDRRRLIEYRPYAKQREFHAKGSVDRERLLMAGNQLGKTFCGAAEAAIHLTGQYPDWWTGRRFDRPVRAWGGSKTGEVTRDGVQRYLIGEPKDQAQWGTGMIPAESLMDWSRRQGVADSLDSAIVKHVSGGVSTIGFKSYDQGRQKWQSETLDFVWFDEEPPMDIYMEGLTRTNATGGMTFITFTPLLGMSDVVSMFLGDE